MRQRMRIVSPDGRRADIQLVASVLRAPCDSRVTQVGVVALQQIQWEGREALSTLRPSSTTSDVARDLIE